MYFEMLNIYIPEEKSFVIFEKGAGQVNPELHRKFLENVDVIIMTGSITNYLQSFDVEIFHDYKLVFKHMIEYLITHWLVCGKEDLTTREAILKLHHLVHKQISALAFEDMS